MTAQEDPARKIAADVAYQFAAMPDMAAAMAAQFPDVAPHDARSVAALFGSEAAEAWQEVARAREKFYEAVRRGP